MANNSPVGTRNSIDQRVMCCLHVRHLGGEDLVSAVYLTPVEAFDRAVAELSETEDRIALITVGIGTGRDEGPQGRCMALTASLGCPGLYLTLAAQDLIRGAVEGDYRFVDAGLMQAEGSERRERIYAVLGERLPRPPTPPVAASLPKPLRSFVGRTEESVRLSELIENRLLISVTGWPGVGKTSLCLFVLRGSLEERTGPVWWVSLEEVRDEAGLIAAVSQVTGIDPIARLGSIETIAVALAKWEGVLVLDGGDYVGPALAEFCREILTRTTTLTMIITAIQPLDIPGEHNLCLGGLSVPAPGHEKNQLGSLTSEAIRLFVERAAEFGCPTQLAEGNVFEIAELGRRLGGSPLAIELAASRLRSSSLKRLLAQLKEDKELTGKAGLFGERHRSLGELAQRAMVGLSQSGRELLLRLSQFEGQFSEATAAEVWEAGESTSGPSVRSVHEQLVDWGFVEADSEGELFRLPNFLRSFLRRPGSDQTAEVIQLDYCRAVARLVERATALLKTAAASGAERLLERHYGDAVRAFRLAVSQPERVELIGSFVRSLPQYWFRRNLLGDAIELGNLALSVEEMDRRDMAYAGVILGVAYLKRRLFTEANSELERALGIYELQDCVSDQAATLGNLGLCAKEAGRFDQAIKYYERSIKLMGQPGEFPRLSAILSNYADTILQAIRAEEPPESKRLRLVKTAARAIGRADGLQQTIQDPWTLQALEHSRGLVAIEHRDLKAAHSALVKAIRICSEHGMRHEASEATEHLVGLYLAWRRPDIAARLLGLTVTIHGEREGLRKEWSVRKVGNLMATLRRRLGTECFESLRMSGAQLTLRDALDLLILV